jgi:hypothetical protein
MMTSRARGVAVVESSRDSHKSSIVGASMALVGNHKPGIVGASMAAVASQHRSGIIGASMAIEA